MVDLSIAMLVITRGYPSIFLRPKNSASAPHSIGVDLRRNPPSPWHRPGCSQSTCDVSGSFHPNMGLQWLFFDMEMWQTCIPIWASNGSTFFVIFSTWKCDSNMDFFLSLSRHTLIFLLGNKVPMVETGVMECNDQRTPPNLRANCIVPCSHGISREKILSPSKKHQRGLKALCSSDNCTWRPLSL